MSDESQNESRIDDTSAALLRARALVLRDIVACGADVPGIVDVLDVAVREREWWVQRWPEGIEFLAGQVAQDVQDRLVDTEGRWPPCPHHPDEALELGAGLRRSRRTGRTAPPGVGGRPEMYSKCTAW